MSGARVAPSWTSDPRELESWPSPYSLKVRMKDLFASQAYIGLGRPGPEDHLRPHPPLQQAGTCPDSAEIINSLNDYLAKGIEYIDPS